MGTGTAAPASGWRRTATAVALLFPVAAGAVTVAAAATFEAPPADDRRGPGWRTVEFGGVEVDVPRSWSTADLGGCDLPLARWAAGAAPTCGDGPGVSILPSATFDPPHGPGVRRPPHGPGPERWSGYALVGDLAVDVSATSPAVVHRVLDSVEDEPSFR
jgi:hypothetical protein